MTSAMLPTQAVSSSSSRTSKPATINDSADEFADTLRGQLDRQLDRPLDRDVEASAPEQTLVEDSHDTSAPEQDAARELAEGMMCGAEVARTLAVSQELELSAMHASTMLPNEGLVDLAEQVEIVDSVQPVADAVTGINAQTAVAEFADSASAHVVPAQVPLPSSALAAPKPTASIAQASTALDTASEADSLRSAPTPPPIRATVQGMALASAHESKDAAQEKLFAQNFTRLSEATSSVSVQSGPSVAPVLGVNHAALEQTAQLPVASALRFSVDTPLASPSSSTAIPAPTPGTLNLFGLRGLALLVRRRLQRPRIQTGSA